MDPGESDLDSSFPQTENPCLIVEDSQPDSVALEDDPDTSYCALLARRLSNLQPTSQSPVLELISSPTKSHCLQTDSQIDKSDISAHPDNLQSNLGSAATEHSQVFEVCSLPISKRSVKEHMESEANSTTHCTETHEEMSQFGLLELSESQGVFEEDERDGAPASQKDSQKPASQCGLKSSERTSSNQDGNSAGSEVSSSCHSKPQDGESRKLSIQAILHSQLPDSQEDEEDVLVSSQDDMFEKERNGTKADSSVSELDKEHLATSTPAQSLRLLHLSGQGTLVQESLSQQSVDFVAATQDNLSQTPYIVPNSPTEKEQNYNEAAESPMDTSAPPEDQPQGREEEPMDMDPCPKPQPTASTPVSQNTPGFVLEKSLSVPSQPEFSHDVFISTPSLEPGNNSQGTEHSKRKLSHQNSPSATESASPKQSGPAEQLKKAASGSFSQPSEGTEGFQLELGSENSSFTQKTQLFMVEEDSQATQIEGEEGTVDADKSSSSPKHPPQTASKNGVDSDPGKTSNSQSLSKVPDSKCTSALPEKAEDCNPSQKPSQAVNLGNQNISATPGATPSQLSVGADCVSDTPNPPLTNKTTVAGCSQVSPSADRPATPVPVPVPQQSQSQSVLTVSSQKNTENEEERAIQSQRLSQPMTHSHSVTTDSVKNAEEEEQMDEDEIQSTVKGNDTGVNLALSQSQVLSPEPMEEENGEEKKETSQCVPSRDHHSSSKEESFSVMVLEESQRVSQEKVKDRRSQPFISSSQPVRGSMQDKHEAKISGSQPVGSTEVSPLQLERTKPQSTQPSDSGQNKVNSDNASNKSLSDSSGELPFHFTLPKDGELIRPAVSATPPQISQLKKTPRHSTPIEMTSFSEPSEADVTRETTMATSEISVEESRECEEPASVEQDGKLSLRMKLVTPVEEGSSGSEHFSLQKPPLTDEEGSVSKATTVAMAVTSSSVFSRVREAHRQVQVEDDAESSDPPLRQPSQPFSPTNTNDLGLSPNCPKETAGSRTSSRDTKAVSLHPGGTGANSEPLVSSLSSPAREQEVLSTSDRPRTPVRQRAVSQQTSVDISSTTSPPRKKAVSQQTSFDLSGPHNLSGRGEPSTPTRTQPGPALRRHVRTIQEVRTTVTRIITDVYYEDGREVDRKVTQESEEPVVDRCVIDNDISPSRTGSSMTSGDLADVSSLSSKAPSHHSSSGTSSGGLGPIRMPDFLMPASRGAKSGRWGGRQQPRTHTVVVGSVVTDARGSRVTTQLSPRGRARRGRPPSRGPLSRGGRTGQRGGAHVQGASSSEEEPFAQRHAQAPGSPVEPSATSRSDSLNTTSPDNSTGSSFVGLRVLAKWSSNSYFYSGSITRDLGENRFRLLFDDNQECEVQGKDILLCDPIPLETEVTALTEEEYFNIGLVKGHKTQDSEFLYCVEKDGQSKWYSRTSVILSMEQGNRLREQYGLGPYEPSTPQTMASDISLDNLVEGKRRRRGNLSGPGTPTRSSSNSPRNPGPSGKRKLISGTEDERTPAKRGRRGGGARVGQRLAACNTSGSGADLPPDPNDLVATHGPLPENSSLFMGFVFMLTTSSESDRDSNHQTSDEDEESVQRAPYNKLYTVRQLEAGGGMILLDFNEEQCKAAYQSLLIADQHCRTRKYLLCVAGGVPCVSQMWVRDCCQEQKLLNYRNYLLPAGLGPEGHIVEWHPRCNPFKALKVMLISEDRVDLWTSLLSMGGAAKVHHHKENEDMSDISNKKLDLAVTASACPSEELKRVAPDMPVVSLEWLIQSLICGKCLSYDSNSEFCHNPST
ncbi:TP53-binding protein 1 isoform X1 [Megalobrama amblycephala]|uniref:TP53-binding protein 1 isoform X1 n=1 Tax=Megalobrama amblycephala TaxID=75352 RepID=UPI0020145877|nr:TP53-binding protein 1 isoform X1 [Megalobrama amblycephala]XP_048041046.1 TP53-binding protein 1 isoform X1 [Megalobrama amblycephala]XP_048041047.1 TP53-binding protein 1 isoform X1 [Megalobrama amblycephala]